MAMDENIISLTWLKQVGPVPGNNWGGIRNKICDDVNLPDERNCGNGWEYHNGNTSVWESDTSLRIKCTGKT